MSGVTSSVILFGLFLAASLTQCIACWIIFSLCGWAYPIPFYLYWKAMPSDSKTLSFANGK